MSTQNVWKQSNALIYPGPNSANTSIESVSISRDGNTLAIASWDQYRGNTNVPFTSASMQSAIFTLNYDSWIRKGNLNNQPLGFNIVTNNNGNIIATTRKSYRLDDSNGSSFQSKNYAHQVVELHFWNNNSWQRIGYITGQSAWSLGGPAIDINAPHDDGTGNSIAISDDGLTLIVGAPYYIHNWLSQNPISNPIRVQAGRVRVFRISDTNSFMDLSTKIGSDIIGNYGDKAGHSVDISSDGNLIAIGYPGYKHPSWGTNTGRVELRKWNPVSQSWDHVVSFTGAALLGTQNSQNIRSTNDRLVGWARVPELFGSKVRLSGDGTTLAVLSGGIDIITVYKLLPQDTTYSPISTRWERIGKIHINDRINIIGSIYGYEKILYEFNTYDRTSLSSIGGISIDLNYDGTKLAVSATSYKGRIEIYDIINGRLLQKNNIINPTGSGITTVGGNISMNGNGATIASSSGPNSNYSNGPVLIYNFITETIQPSPSPEPQIPTTPVVINPPLPNTHTINNPTIPSSNISRGFGEKLVPTKNFPMDTVPIVYGWGLNDKGQIGDKTISDPYESPSQTWNDRSRLVWDRISTGNNHSVAIDTKNRLWVWGDNSQGQVQYESIKSYISSPIAVYDGLWRYISAGNNHTLAIKYDNTLWIWGNNSNGQIGNGTTQSKSPMQKIGSDVWLAIAGGTNYSLAIKGDGTLWGWGSNNFGQLGDGSTTQRLAPTQIGTDTWNSISAGNEHSLGIKDDGTLWAWGRNSDGRLGDGSIIDKLSPVQIGSDKWISVSAGGSHSLAIKEDGTLWVWGNNSNGQLGDGSTIQKLSPIQLNTKIWITINAGLSNSLGIDEDGKLWGWGLNTSGQLGDGSKIDKFTPTLIGDKLWQTVSSKGYHALAIAEPAPTPGIKLKVKSPKFKPQTRITSHTITNNLSAPEISVVETKKLDWMEKVAQAAREEFEQRIKFTDKTITFLNIARKRDAYIYKRMMEFSAAENSIKNR